MAKGKSKDKGKKRTPTSQLHGAALAKRLASEAKLGKTAKGGRGSSAAGRISSEYADLVKHMQEDKLIRPEGRAFEEVATEDVSGVFGVKHMRPTYITYRAKFDAEAINKEISKAGKTAFEAAKKIIVANKARDTLRRRLERHYGPAEVERIFKIEDEKIKERAAKATTTKAESEGGR